jgi:hypothetical protein
MDFLKEPPDITVAVEAPHSSYDVHVVSPLARWETLVGLGCTDMERGGLRTLRSPPSSSSTTFIRACERLSTRIAFATIHRSTDCRPSLASGRARWQRRTRKTR